MTIATWNVNGIRARHTQVQQWLETEKLDVVCLQEIKATPEQVPATLCALSDYWCYWHGGAKGYSGVSLQVRKDFWPKPPRFSHPPFDFENRIVVAELGSLTIASVYVPNGGKDFAAKMRFLAAMEEYIASFRERGMALILCGDLNIARDEIDVHPKERNANVTGQMPEERALFEWMLARGVVDLGRELHPDDEGMFTWWAPWRNMRARNIGWRLDYILASATLAETAQSCVVAKEFGTSDHAPVVANFLPPTD